MFQMSKAVTFLLLNAVNAMLFCGCGENGAFLPKEGMVGHQSDTSHPEKRTVSQTSDKSYRTESGHGSPLSTADAIEAISHLADGVHPNDMFFGLNRVDHLVNRVNGILNGCRCRSRNASDMVVERTAIVAPFVRAVEGYWVGRQVECGQADSTGKTIDEIFYFYHLTTRTADLVRTRVGNYSIAASLDLNIYSELRQLADRFEIKSNIEGKSAVDGLLKNWVKDRYDTSGESALRAACERIEYYAVQSLDRGRLPEAVRSWRENFIMRKAVKLVGRYPRWAEEWQNKHGKEDHSIK